jgi:hypothetical protein
LSKKILMMGDRHIIRWCLAKFLALAAQR